MSKHVVIHLKSEAMERKILKFLAAEIDASDYKYTENLGEYVAEHCTDSSGNNDGVAPSTMDRNIVAHGADMSFNDPNFQSTLSARSQLERMMEGTTIAYRYRTMEPKQEPIDGVDAVAPPTMSRNVGADKLPIDENVAPSSAFNSRRDTVNPALRAVKQAMLEEVMVEEGMGNRIDDNRATTKPKIRRRKVPFSVDTKPNDGPSSSSAPRRRKSASYPEVMVEPKQELMDEEEVDDNVRNVQENDGLNVEVDFDAQIDALSDEELARQIEEMDTDIDTENEMNNEVVPSRRSSRIEKRTRDAMENDNDNRSQFSTKEACQKCGEKKDNFQKKINHAFHHLKMTRFQCMIGRCGFKTGYKEGIKSHMSRKHKNQMHGFREVECTRDQAEFEQMKMECFPKTFNNTDNSCRFCQRVIGVNSSNSLFHKRDHALGHVDFMRFKCMEHGCTFETNTESSMNGHKGIHEDTRNAKFARLELTKEQQLEVESIVQRCFPKLGERNNGENETDQ